MGNSKDVIKFGELYKEVSSERRSRRTNYTVKWIIKKQKREAKKDDIGYFEGKQDVQGVGEQSKESKETNRLVNEGQELGTTEKQRRRGDQDQVIKQIST